ncbi:unnamed protein product [Rhodiola kirilowii]
MTQPPSYAWTTRHLPLFGGTDGEDPVQHCRNFHHVCQHIKPNNETLEEFKLNCFKFSLTDFATIWYYTSTAMNARYFMDISIPFLKEFSPPSLRQQTREKTTNLQQSRDETLGEYYTNYNTIVSRCPHHGFMEVFLLQKFLCGMRADEFSRINNAVGGTTTHLSLLQIWDVIDSLAGTAIQRPRSRPNEGIRRDEASPERDIAEDVMNESDTEGSEKEPTLEVTSEPSEETPEPSEESDMESTGSNTRMVAKFDLSHPWDPNQ